MSNVVHTQSLLADLRGLIEQARELVAQTANSALTLTGDCCDAVAIIGSALWQGIQPLGRQWGHHYTREDSKREMMYVQWETWPRA